MTKYRKLIVAVIGVVALLVTNLAGIEIGPEAEGAAVSVVDAVILLLTALGVEEVPNDHAFRGA